MPRLPTTSPRERQRWSRVGRPRRPQLTGKLPFTVTPFTTWDLAGFYGSQPLFLALLGSDCPVPKPTWMASIA